MPKIIDSPTIVEAAGNKPKIIEEFFGHNEITFISFFNEA